MANKKYKIDSVCGNLHYIIQLSPCGTQEAIYKGVPDYNRYEYKLYKHKALIKGAPDYRNKIISWDDVDRSVLFPDPRLAT
jgi:hypothetical protein